MSDRQVASNARETDGGSPTTTLRALVVDDEPHIRSLLVRLLQQAGFNRIEELPDGKAAVAAIEREQVDLMLLDLAMPGIRGEEVARRTLELWPRAAVIVITGHATIDGAVDLMKSGVFDLVRKPFEFRTLRATLGRAVDRLGARPATAGPADRKLGKYALLNELASGGMGTVYRAKDTETEQIVALKILRVGRPDPEQVVRFQMEASTLARLEHANIVAVHDIGLHEGVHFLAMAFIEGVHLGELIYANKLSFRRGLQLLATVAEAVAHAHEHGVLHRDLKPSNILVDADGTAHIIDFGLAKYLHSSLRLTRTDLVLGTFGYLAPERLAGGTIDEGVDIFSLGAILYEMLTHRLPYERENDPEGFPVFNEKLRPPSAINHAVPEPLDAICMRALAVDRAARYASAAEFAADLRTFLRDSDGGGSPPGA
ncbi:MAG: serine/threonine-protein kinase [Planctomycetota bacterium]|jgi:DNA-binding response OmpR family regulator